MEMILTLPKPLSFEDFTVMAKQDLCGEKRGGGQGC